MRPPVLPSGNFIGCNIPGRFQMCRIPPASMRPPVLPSGNSSIGSLLSNCRRDHASMRPPVLPSGNKLSKRKKGQRTANHASMRPPVLPSGNYTRRRIAWLRQSPCCDASMRPPVLPSGNPGSWLVPAKGRPEVQASMRPPVLPSGNQRVRHAGRNTAEPSRCFNEAAGFTQRKPARTRSCTSSSTLASMRPPVLPSGNADFNRLQDHPPKTCFNEAAGFTQRKPTRRRGGPASGMWSGFNEAAGFTQRKPGYRPGQNVPEHPASMRPPVLPSGNPTGSPAWTVYGQGDASMRPPVLPSGNPVAKR